MPELVRYKMYLTYGKRTDYKEIWAPSDRGAKRIATNIARRELLEPLNHKHKWTWKDWSTKNAHFERDFVCCTITLYRPKDSVESTMFKWHYNAKVKEAARHVQTIRFKELLRSRIWGDRKRYKNAEYNVKQ